MKKIAVTGGIGSGKSTICSYIEKIGYDVFYSDIAAIEIATNDKLLVREIIENFGEQSYLPDGTYNRSYIADIVFNDKSKLAIINKLFKPYLENKFNEFCEGKQVIFYESALIFENDIVNKFDHVICVYAELNTVTKRLKYRNNYSVEDIEKRLKNQLDPKEKIYLSDFLIDTTKGNYKRQVKSILNKILD